MVPTARALQLAEPIADILARARGVISSSQGFDPAKSTRRFMIGAPDAISAVTLSPLLAALRRAAPRVDLSVRALMPQTSLAALDAREVDIAIAPMTEVPPRFASRELYIEDFVIAMRAGHPFARTPTLERYCAASHLVVSMSGDPHSFVDESLEELNLARRVALAVPSFVFALAVLSETDLIAALPRMLVEEACSAIQSQPRRGTAASTAIAALLDQGHRAEGCARWMQVPLGCSICCRGVSRPARKFSASAPHPRPRAWRGSHTS